MEHLEDYFKFHKKKSESQDHPTSLAEIWNNPPNVPSFHFVKGEALIKEGETHERTSHTPKSPPWSKASPR